jgi:two-component system chemotaxis response regulator CheB
MTGERPSAPGRPEAPDLVVVVVSSGPVRTRELVGMLESTGITVAALAGTAAEAEAAVVATAPGAVLVDLPPEAGGIEAIERIMGTRPTPVVVCGDLVEHSQAALAAGAVDVVGALDAAPASPEYVVALRRHLTVASRVRVITHPRNRLRSKGLHPSVPAQPAAPPGEGTSPPGAVPFVSPVRAVVIGASTGGPPALASILADLPPAFPAPVLVVQHMADGFVEGLASWLDGLTRLRVVMAADGRRLTPGVIHVAPAGLNTVLRPGLLVELRDPDPGQFHLPGVDAAFRSAATVCGPRAVGVLLTGMGKDGAEGLLAMRRAGALTIAQDEPSCVVWGMPAAALALHAVEQELPLSRIAGALTAAAAPHRRRA